MRFFFRSRQFKIIAGVLAALIVTAAILIAVGGMISPQSGIVGSLLEPFERVGASVGAYVRDFSAAVGDNQAIMRENIELRAELDKLRQELAETQDAAAKADVYSKYLGIKDEHPEFELMPAAVITKDIDDPYGGFTVNKGSINGVSLNDPVITDAGLVGFVSDISLSYCKVTTVKSPEIKVAATDSRSGDIGVVSGTLELAGDGLCRLYNLSKSNNVALGDIVLTSGGGVFPEGLVIGTISDVRSEKSDVSIYAVVEPAANFDDLRNVMIITYF